MLCRSQRPLVLASMLLVALTALAACAQSSAKATTLPTPTTGAIEISIDRPSYTAAQPIGVSIANNDKQGVYALNGRTGCTFLQLELYNPTKKTWSPTAPCGTVDPVRALLIPSGAHEPFTLPPGNNSADANSWVPGTYRISLRYGTKPDASGDVQVAYSSAFQITA
jgi:hypothetical protein